MNQSYVTEAKDAYKGLGKGLMAFYFVNALVSTIVMVVWSIIIICTSPYYDIVYSNNSIYDVIASITVLLEKSLEHSDWGGWMFAISSVAGMAAGLLVLWLIQRKRTTTFASYPVTLRTSDFFILLFIVFGLWCIGCVLGNAPKLLGMPANDPFVAIEAYLGNGIMPLYLYSVIGAPFFEELVCRKLLMDKICGYDETVACFVSALVFGLIHGNSTQFPYAFLLGLIFAMIYAKTRNVGYTILMHMIINTIGILPAFFALYGYDISHGWDIFMLCIAILGVVTMILFRNHPVLKIQKGDIPEIRKIAFKTSWMRTFISLGSLLTVAMGVFNFALEMLNRKMDHNPDLWTPHLLLIPVFISIAMILTCTIFVGRKRPSARHTFDNNQEGEE